MEGEGDGYVGEDGRGIGVDRGDDDGPRCHLKRGGESPLLLLLP